MEARKTDVDINYQHFDFFCVPNCTQWNFNGFAILQDQLPKKYCQPMYHRRRRRIGKKDTIDYFATQCLKISCLRIQHLPHFSVNFSIYAFVNFHQIELITK